MTHICLVERYQTNKRRNRNLSRLKVHRTNTFYEAYVQLKSLFSWASLQLNKNRKWRLTLAEIGISLFLNEEFLGEEPRAGEAALWCHSNWAHSAAPSPLWVWISFLGVCLIDKGDTGKGSEVAPAGLRSISQCVSLPKTHITYDLSDDLVFIRQSSGSLGMTL